MDRRSQREELRRHHVKRHAIVAFDRDGVPLHYGDRVLVAEPRRGAARQYEAFVTWGYPLQSSFLCLGLAYDQRFEAVLGPVLCTQRSYVRAT